jgi:hypothetical protein
LRRCAKEGPYQHDYSEHENPVKRWSDGDGADNAGCHEEFEAEQNPPAQIPTETSVAVRLPVARMAILRYLNGQSLASPSTSGGNQNPSSKICLRTEDLVLAAWG